MFEKDSLKIILNKINHLLNTAGEGEWNKVFMNFLTRINNVENFNDLITDILRIYGGMGSFSDLVLYSKGELLINENQELEKFRKILFEVSMKIKTDIRKKRVCD